MKNYMKIIIAFLVLFSSFFVCSQQLPTKDNFKLNFNVPKSNEYKNGIIFSLGAGSSVYETSFILSPDITWDLTEHASVSTGTDIYLNGKKSDTRISINLISYYKFKPSEKSILQIGFGGAYYRNNILPLFSSRYDHKMFGNSYIGVGIKSLISFGGDKFPFPLIMLNYSVKF
jgi:hypothetical protein